MATESPLRPALGRDSSLVSFPETILLTPVTISVTSPPSRSRRDLREGTFESERERSPRAGLRPASGRLRASFTPVLRPVREVLSLDWDRRRRVTPAGSKSQEAWPGVEPAGAKPLARAAVERREASASRRTRAAPPPRPPHERGMKVGTRSVVGCVFRRSASLLFGEVLAIL
jgi:hypothetical protein